MRYFIIVFAIAVITLSSCDSIEPNVNRKAPANLIEKNEMVEVLYDLQLIQAAYKGRTHNDTDAVETRDSRTIRLLESHNLTQIEFENSLDYYHKSPAEMEDIYGEVITKLNLKIAQLEEKLD